jgi:hypothetical protein
MATALDTSVEEEVLEDDDDDVVPDCVDALFCFAVAFCSSLSKREFC